MATNLTLQLAGMLNLSAKAANAVASEDGDTKLKSVCCGGGTVQSGDKAGEPLLEHDPVVPTCTVKCSTCGRTQSSWHGWDKARDNGDSTFTVPDAEEMKAAVASDEHKKTPAMLVHPLDQVESQTMHHGRTYILGLMKDKDAPLYGAFVQVVNELRTEGYVPVVRWAVSTAVATFQLVTLGRVLALQELATPDMLKARPAVDYPEARPEHVALIKTAAMLSVGDFVAADYENEQAKLVAKALANGKALSGGAAPLAATATGSMEDMMAQLRERLASGDKVPAQPLPSEVPANVDTTLVAPTPRKRAPAKKATTTRKAAPKVA